MYYYTAAYPDPEVRSSRRVQCCIVYPSAQPGLLIKICHCCYIQINNAQIVTAALAYLDSDCTNKLQWNFWNQRNIKHIRAFKMCQLSWTNTIHSKNLTNYNHHVSCWFYILTGFQYEKSYVHLKSKLLKHVFLNYQYYITATKENISPAARWNTEYILCALLSSNGTIS